MSEDAQRQWVEQRLLNGITITFPDWDIASALEIPNVEFNPPKGLPYFCYSILGGEAKQSELVEGGYERHVGVLQIDVLVPDDGTGPGNLTRLATWATKLFSRQSAVLADNSRLNHRVGSHTYLGKNSELLRRACSIPYWRDERPIPII